MKPAAMKEETRYARQLYLFGEGKQKPVRNIRELARLSGCSESTIGNWTPQWRKEAEELALRCEDSPYTLALSSEVITQHQKEIDFLGRQVKKLRARLSKIGTDSPNYPVILTAYQSALTKWEKSSGILAHYETAAAAMRETAKAKAKAMAKRAEELDDTIKPAGRIDGSRFDTGE